ncbi:hypothetical protein J0S82_010608, partial [Galemys pyrenaicus]
MPNTLRLRQQTSVFTTGCDHEQQHWQQLRAVPAAVTAAPHGEEGNGAATPPETSPTHSSRPALDSQPELARHKEENSSATPSKMAH